MLQWIVDHVVPLLGSGGLGAFGSVLALRTASRKREVAALERETAREQRMAAMERRLDERDETITELRTENEDCRRRGAECDQRTSVLEHRVSERDDAIEELQAMLLREGRSVRHRITPREFPAVLDDPAKDRWSDLDD